MKQDDVLARRARAPSGSCSCSSSFSVLARGWLRGGLEFCGKNLAGIVLSLAAANIISSICVLAALSEKEGYWWIRALAKTLTQLVAAFVAIVMLLFRSSSFLRLVAAYAVVNWLAMWFSTVLGLHDISENLDSVLHLILWLATYSTSIASWIIFCLAVVEQVAALEKACVIGVNPWLRRLLWMQLALGLAFTPLLFSGTGRLFLELVGLGVWAAVLLIAAWSVLAVRALFLGSLLAARAASHNSTHAKEKRRMATGGLFQTLSVVLAASTTIAKFVLSMWTECTCLWPVIPCSDLAVSNLELAKQKQQRANSCIGWLQLGVEVAECLGNSVSALWIAGAFSGALIAAARKQSLQRGSARKRTLVAEQWRPDEDARWHQKVCEMATRGLTLEALLGFYRGLGSDCMPHWDPSRHTTADVAIIPRTASAQCALATLLMDGAPTQPAKMVTHSWGNLFRDLVAAVCADALNEAEYGEIAGLLERRDVGRVELWIQQAGQLQTTYWICAFSVNQHCTICGSNPHGSRDSVTGFVHPVCECDLPKMWNQTPPLSAAGKGIPCEVNKFVDMMKLLAVSNRGFEQVVAIDAEFDLFSRAWCVAELGAANAMGMRQRLKLQSAAGLASNEVRLRALNIEDMTASRQEDKDEILAGIPDVAAFNEELQRLIFQDLLPSWRDLDALEKMECVARLARWQHVLPACTEPV